jgi:sec-independent protein translocase protein TatA
MNPFIILGVFGLGSTELIVILVVVLLLFGGRKIPEFMKGLGTGIKEFKDASKGTSEGKTTPEKKD